MTADTVALARHFRSKCISQLLLSSERASLSDILSAESMKVTNRLKAALSLPETACEIVLFPSGSDAEYLPILMASARRARLSLRGPVYNVVVAGGEVGSGTDLAAGGKHYSSLSCTGISATGSVRAGDYLRGFCSSDSMLVHIAARDAQSGTLTHDDVVVDKVCGILQSDASAVAILHVVCGSKSGAQLPSWDCVNTLTEKFGERLLVVVDACQLRVSQTAVRSYVNSNYVVLVTGSKFYCAPAFWLVCITFLFCLR